MESTHGTEWLKLEKMRLLRKSYILSIRRWINSQANIYAEIVHIAVSSNFWSDVAYGTDSLRGVLSQTITFRN